MDPLTTLLLILGIPIGILVGLGASVIGLTAWPLIVPLFFVIGGFSLHESLLSSMIIDVMLALVLSVFYSRTEEVDVDRSYGIKLGSTAGIIAVVFALIAFPLLIQFSDAFKSGASIVNYVFGSIFIIQAIRTKNGGKKEESAEPSRLQSWREGLTQKQKNLVVFGFVSLQGVLTGILAIGGAMNIVIMLILVLGYPTLKAVGTAMMATTIMLSMTVVAYLLLLGFVSTTWLLILVYGVIAVISCVGGALQAQRISERSIRFVIGTVILAAAIFATLQITILG